METIPREEIVKKARGIVSPLIEKENGFTKKLSGNVAVITTAVTIFAYVVLYSFKIGYYGTFNIPAKCIQIDLRDYLPVLVQISGISIYMVWYMLFIKADIALKQAMFQWYRVLYGFIIIYYLLSANDFLRSSSKIPISIIAFCAALVIELIVYFFFSFRGFADVKKDDEKKAIENAALDLLMYHSTVRNGVFLVLITVIIAPLIGQGYAKNDSSFQVFKKDDKEYAVIVDYGERVLAQEAHTENGTLLIDISHYTFLSKEGLSFENTVFNATSLLSSLDANNPSLDGPDKSVITLPIEEENNITVPSESALIQEETNEGKSSPAEEPES